MLQECVYFKFQSLCFLNLKWKKQKKNIFLNHLPPSYKIVRWNTISRSFIITPYIMLRSCYIKQYLINAKPNKTAANLDLYSALSSSKAMINNRIQHLQVINLEFKPCLTWEFHAWKLVLILHVGLNSATLVLTTKCRTYKILFRFYNRYWERSSFL